MRSLPVLHVQILQVDLTNLVTLQERAAKKCHIKEDEGLACPATAETTDSPDPKADTSAANPLTVLAGVALVLTATMN